MYQSTSCFRKGIIGSVNTSLQFDFQQETELQPLAQPNGLWGQVFVLILWAACRVFQVFLCLFLTVNLFIRTIWI